MKVATSSAECPEALCELGTGEPARPRIANEESRAETIALYTEGAHIYDRLNQLLSGGTGNWYRRQAVRALDLPPAARVLDLACGTGALAIAAQQVLPTSSTILAVDPTPAMRDRAARAGVADVRDGNFMAIPAENASCDAVISGYALRYAEPREVAFQEIRRVLRPNGELLLLEMSVPTSGWRRALTRQTLTNLVAPLSSLLCRDPSAGRLIQHLWQSISGLDAPEIILSDLKRAGFSSLAYTHVGGLLGEFRGRAPRG